MFTHGIATTRAEFDYDLARRSLQTLVLVGITLLAVGVAFPIYGSPAMTGIGRLTVFRAGLLFMLVAAPLWLRELPDILKDGRIACLLLFGALRVVSLVWTPGAYWGVTQIRWFGESLICLLTVIACARAYPSSFKYLFRALLLAGGLSALAVSVQYLQFRTTGSAHPLPFALSPLGLQVVPDDGWYPLGQGGRILGAFQEPNLTGSFMVYVLCLSLPAALFEPQRLFRAIGWVVSVLCGMGVLASGSRQGMAVMVVVIMLLAARVGVRRPAIATLLIGGLGVAIWYVYHMITTILQGVGIDVQTAIALERLAQAAETGDISGGRFDWYRRAFATLDIDTILLGHGEGAAFSLDVITVHNAFITVLVENGVWALGLLVGAIVLMLWITNRDRVRLAGVLPQSWLEGGSLITLTWAMLIGLNWAQMNQLYAWPFLAIGFAGLALPTAVSPRREEA